MIAVEIKSKDPGSEWEVTCLAGKSTCPGWTRRHFFQTLYLAYDEYNSPSQASVILKLKRITNTKRLL